jgi:quercetin dioxygenase-like cupin family protein
MLVAPHDEQETTMPTTEVAQSLVLDDLASHLPMPVAATTSRVVVNNALLRMVAFAMDGGQELTDHASPRAVTVHVTHGELAFTVQGAEHRLVQGDVVYLAPGERHALVARSACRFLLVLVDVERSAAGDAPA